MAEKIETTEDEDKKKMYLGQNEKALECLKRLEADGSLSSEQLNQILEECRDAMSAWLDKKLGSTVEDNSIFNALPRYWEKEYFDDMNALNVSGRFSCLVG